MTTANFIPTAEGLVEYAKEKLTAPNFYLWDGVGEYITDDVIDRLAAADPVWYTPERIAARRALVGKNVRGWDCIGLIISYKWGDYHQGKPEQFVKGEHWSTAQLIEMEDLVKGDISTLPERPGLVLKKKDTWALHRRRARDRVHQPRPRNRTARRGRRHCGNRPFRCGMDPLAAVPRHSVLSIKNPRTCCAGIF